MSSPYIEILLDDFGEFFLGTTWENSSGGTVDCPQFGGHSRASAQGLAETWNNLRTYYADRLHSRFHFVQGTTEQHVGNP